MEAFAYCIIEFLGEGKKRFRFLRSTFLYSTIINKDINTFISRFIRKLIDIYPQISISSSRFGT